jgi:hypothetical protein
MAVEEIAAAAEETIVAAEKVMAAVPDKGKKIADAASEKGTSTIRTWWVKNCSRPRRRSYRNMGYLVATSQELCSLVELTKEP